MNIGRTREEELFDKALDIFEILVDGRMVQHPPTPSQKEGAREFLMTSVALSIHYKNVDRLEMDSEEYPDVIEEIEEDGK